MKRITFVLGILLGFSHLMAWEETSPRSPASPVILTKPATLGALRWLQQLENDRDEAELTGNRGMLDAIAAETKATLGGKYGLSNRQATAEERVIMIASIQRNCRIAPYALRTMDGYLAYVPQEGLAPHLQADPLLASHLGAILAIVAITNAGLQSADIADAWMTCQQGHTSFSSDFQASLHKEAHRQSSAPLWSSLESPFTHVLTHHTSLWDEAWEGFQFLPPRLHLRDVIDDLLGGGGEDYKGWEVHGLSSLGRWPDIPGQSTGQALHGIYKACAKGGGYWEPLLSRALCLTPGTSRWVSYLDEAFYDGKTWAVELMFTHNLEGQTPAIVNLVLTRKGSIGNTPLSRALDFKAKQEAYWSSLAYRPSLFTLVDEFSIFEKAYAFDFEGGGYDLATLVEQGATSVPLGSLRAYLAQSGFKGHAQALYALAKLWEEGKDGFPDTQMARRLYERSADLGYAQAQYVYGTLLWEEGDPSTPSHEAQTYLRRAAEQGHRQAQHKLTGETSSPRGNVQEGAGISGSGFASVSLSHAWQTVSQFMAGESPDPGSLMGAFATLLEGLPPLPQWH